MFVKVIESPNEDVLRELDNKVVEEKIKAAEKLKVTRQERMRALMTSKWAREEGCTDSVTPLHELQRLRGPLSGLGISVINAESDYEKVKVIVGEQEVDVGTMVPVALWSGNSVNKGSNKHEPGKRKRS